MKPINYLTIGGAVLMLLIAVLVFRHGTVYGNKTRSLERTAGEHEQAIARQAEQARAIIQALLEWQRLGLVHTHQQTNATGNEP